MHGFGQCEFHPGKGDDGHESLPVEESFAFRQPITPAALEHKEHFSAPAADSEPKIGDEPSLSPTEVSQNSTPAEFYVTAVAHPWGTQDVAFASYPEVLSQPDFYLPSDSGSESSCFILQLFYVSE